MASKDKLGLTPYLTMEEITDIFISIIKQSQSIHDAESEFRHLLIDDDDLRRRYREYCREIGISKKNGFLDFCEEYLQDQNAVWDSLNDYDE